MAHLIMDIANVPGDVDISTVSPIETALVSVAEHTSATIVNRAHHQFQPYGATVILLLAESHISAHSYPEYRKIHIDYYHCGRNARERLTHAADLFRRIYGPGASFTVFDRP